MKILHVETGRHFFGGAQQVIWLMSALAEQGTDGVLVCPPGSKIDSIARQNDLPVQNIHCAGDLDLGFAWRLARYARQEKPDLIHCHSRRGADFSGGIGASVAGIPAIVSRRVDREESSLVAALRYRLFRRIIAISEHIATQLRRHAGLADKVVVIRSAVDVEGMAATPDCNTFRETFGLHDAEFTIAVVAQLIKRKGHRFLFDVLPNLVDACPGLRVVVFGSGNGENQLRALVTGLSLNDVVQFAGFRDDLDDYLACFDLLVHPATEEGLGVAMLKAAALKVPVVAFDIAGSREAVVHGKTGTLVPPGDLGMLQKAIALMIEEPDMRAEYGAAGNARMQAEFSVRQMARQHRSLYESVLNE